MKQIKINIRPSKLQADIKTKGDKTTINLDSNVIYSPLDCSTTINQTITDTILENGEYRYTYNRLEYTGLDTVVLDVSVYNMDTYNSGVADGKEEQKSLMTSLVVTENGTYTREDGYSDVSVNVPPTPLQDASVSYTQNGEYTITPDPGYALSQVDVSVNLDTSAFYEEGRTVGRVEGYNQGYREGEVEGYNDGYPAGEAAQKAKLTSLVVTSNGTYTREDGYSDVSVNVPSTPLIPTQTKSVVYTSNGEYTVTPDAHYNLSQVDVSVNIDTEAYYDLGYDDGVDDQKAKLTSLVVTSNGTYSRADGYSDVSVNVPSTQPVPTQSKSVSYTQNGEYTILPDSGYNLSQVDVSVNLDTSAYYYQGYADASTEKYNEGYEDGSIAGAAHQKSLLDSSTFTINGTYTRENGWNEVTIDVPSSPGGSLQAKTVDASITAVSVLPDASFYGLSEVTVNAVDASIDPNILPENIKKDVVILGVTGTLDSSSAPAGPVYQTYEYLRYPNGHAFYDTGVTLNLDTVVEIKTNILNDGNITHGIYTEQRDNSELRLFGYSNQYYYDRYYPTYRINGGTNDGGVHVLEFGNYYINVDGTQAISGAPVTSSSTVGKYSTANIGIFGAYTQPNMSQYTTANGDVTVYYCKIYDGSTLVRDFVPATDASGNVGLLDKVNLEFYQNIDSGDASLGGYIGNYPSGGGTAVYQSKTVDSSTIEQVITPDASLGYNALSQVTIRPVTAAIDPDIIGSNIKQGVEILGVTGTLVSSYNGRNQTKTVDSSTVSQTVTFDSPDYTGLSEVTINPYALETATVDSSTGTQVIIPGVNYDGIGELTIRPYVLDSKTVNPSTSTIIVTSDASALAQVTINPVTSAIDPDIKPENIKAGVNILGVTGELTDTTQINLQDKTVTPGSTQIQVTADSGYNGLGTVYVNVAPTETVTVDSSTGQQVITPSSGKVGMSQVTINPYVLQSVTVDSSTSAQTINPDASYDGISQVVVNAYSIQTKTVAPSTSQQTIVPDSSYDALSQVTVNAVTSSIDSNIKPENIIQGVTILGVTGNYTSPSSVSLGYEEIYRRLINI